MSDSATISTPFIFLRPLHRRDIGSKKALLGASVSNLMNIANKLFKQYGTIKAIYTEAGQLVNDMSMVVPNATYYVSTVEPDLRKIEGNEIDRTRKTKKPIVQTKAKSAFNKLFGNETTFDEETRAHQEEQRRLEEEEMRKQEAEERARAEKERQDRKRQEEEKRKYRKAELHKRFEKNRQQNKANLSARKQQSGNQGLLVMNEQDDEYEYDYDDDVDNNSNFSPASQKSNRSNRSSLIPQPAQSRNSKAPNAAKSQQKSKTPTRNAQYNKNDEDEYYSDEYYDDYDDEEQANNQQKSGKQQSNAAKKGTPAKSPLQSSKQQQNGNKEKLTTPLSSKQNQSKVGNSSAQKNQSQNNQRKTPIQNSLKATSKPKDDEYYSDEYYDEYYSDDEEPAPKAKAAAQSKKPVAKKQVTIASTPTTSNNKKQQQNKYGFEDDEFVFNDDGDAYNIDEADSPTLKSALKNLEQQEDDDQFVFDDSAPRSATIDTIFTELLGEHEMDSKIWDGLDKLKKTVSQFIDNSPNLEIKQENSWFNKIFQSLKDQFTLTDYSSIMFKDVLANAARQLIHNHHFPVSSNISYAMKVAVVGPRHSGKSTYLTVLAHELFADLVASGGWKHTFIFFANLQIIHSLFHTFEGIYNTICDITFDMLAVQKPVLAQYTPTLKKYFASALTNKHTSPNFSLKSKFAIEQPALAQQFTKLAKKIWSAYHNPIGMNEFLSYTFLIPRFVSSAAGFIRTFFILDNFECSSVNVEPKAPFSHPDNLTTNLSEYWKFALERSNFIVSCEEQESFFDILPPYFDGGIDFVRSLEFVSTLNMVDEDMFIPDDSKSVVSTQSSVVQPVSRMTEEDKQRAGSVLNVTINGYKQPFKFTFNMCGGCVAFVNQWFELLEEIEKYEQIADNDELAKEEKRLEVVSQVQQVIDDLFISRDSPRKGEETQEDRDSSILVTNVTRSMK